MNWKDLTSRMNTVCIGTFGEDVVFKPVGDDPVTVKAVFDNNFQQVDPETNAPVSTNALMLGMQTSDLPRTPKEGDEFTIRGTDHKVIDAQEDSEGHVKVLLHLKVSRSGK